MKLLYEGKAKKMFTTEIKDELLMRFKDDATAFNGVKKEALKDKGRTNKEFTVKIYNLLEKNNVKTHFVKEINETDIIVKKVKIIPVEVVVRNIAAGSLAKRIGVEEGTKLIFPVIEYYYKSDNLGDPMINTDHIFALKLADRNELLKIREIAVRINYLLSDFFNKIGIKLVDFKIELGRLSDGEIILADEITPDTCRLWDAETNKKLDKDRFRRDLGKVIESYKDVLGRIEDAVSCL